MSAIIATTPYTYSTSSSPAMFDAGRQPLATLHSNTPEQKMSVKVRKHTDVFFCPRAANPWGNPVQSPVKVKNVSKPKRSVEVPQRIADVFSPQAVSSSTNTTYTLNEIGVEDFCGDDDIPIAKLMEMALSSLATGPSTLRRVPRVKKHVGPKDSGDPDDEDLPLSRVKELMTKLGRRPAHIRFVGGCPPAFKHKLLRPATIPMKCIASNCPFEWHEHVNAASC